ncbi:MULTISPECIES: DNA gyrase subunit A [Dehalococcoides]|jgi:DNA gyrase subunit A|uniref:DNA gyrase subunit A n=4 Tax=Dehalococcoides mccartyi TaxID=61435 RepID=A0A142VC83_9CHLR|nr:MULTISPECIES: DNA gyrase subunit A [Dehalococcoides]AGG07102.1 DNA gyrase subunit A [Dehalococcoides mccartyi DCMB5]AGG08631.1 DNA gyrase subunit A [Dehalococcoides mccartyi BTF08]AII61614.1 DNA gyrase subunit A [Dehalococcoides mccartyi CG5]AMU87418.1 DNA gyrase subunit A [Dehalococcoides mccartyi]AOW00060.1 DNA gyrase subunit A [Dehalococcoides mccartyi]
MVTGNTRPINIEDEMKGSYLDYAMSVIVSRALPDVRDGLKPVQRRILYAMNDLGMKHNTPYKKSARIVGEVLGKYHPHGDSSVYDAMVRMAQPFSYRYPLVDGQGNFGSVDNDPAAAMRYTEARLAQIAEHLLADIDKNTVDFMPNFDSSLEEPTVLPARIPNLLMNGSSGIAVGMATNIPPHNLAELCQAICYLIDNPDCGVDELMQFVSGPDFPTGGTILGTDGIKSAYATGKGKIVIQAKAHIGEVETRKAIFVTEIPYQVNKAELVAKIAELVKERKVTGISDLRDESDRQGMRVVIELKRDAEPQQVLNSLYKHTNMRTSFFVNMLALVDGQPQVLSLKEVLKNFIDFRHLIITRRSQFELKAAKDRAHILEGLKKALDFIDRIIAIIRGSENGDAARKNLIAEFDFSVVQAQAILDLQLRRLANLERQKILDEYAELMKRIGYLEDLLSHPEKIYALVKEDAKDLKSSYGQPRATEISNQGVIEFRVEDLVPHMDVIVTLSERGFIKRVPANVFRLQHRGGTGIMGMPTREADAVRFLSVSDTHDTLLFFTNRGKVFSLRCFDIPDDSSRIAKGTAIVNLIPVTQDERITAILDLKSFPADHFLLMATNKGEIKKTSLQEFTAVRSSGLIAMDLTASDELVAAVETIEEKDILLATRLGQSIRFPVSELRTSLRASGGVKAIVLSMEDEVVSMDVAQEGTMVITVTENGAGKLTAIEEYPQQHRAGSGVINFKVVDKTGEVVASKVVSVTDQMMLISADGMVTRTQVKEEDPSHGIPIMGRATQGVRVMRLEEGDRVVAVATF